jgi:tetratricopeptide (TPR) repeat protein
VLVARFFALIVFSASLYAQIFTSPGHGSPDPFRGPLLSASGDASLDAFPPIVSNPRPIEGLVSIDELRHPVSKKARQEAYDAQRLARANKISKAIAKLEDAIRIDPLYRDAHLNLGVQYAMLGRVAEARAQFQKALDIGPPVAAIYFDLALSSARLREFSDAEKYARKTLDLDPNHKLAQAVLDYSLTH